MLYLSPTSHEDTNDWVTDELNNLKEIEFFYESYIWIREYLKLPDTVSSQMSILHSLKKVNEANLIFRNALVTPHFLYS